MRPNLGTRLFSRCALQCSFPCMHYVPIHTKINWKPQDTEGHQSSQVHVVCRSSTSTAHPSKDLEGPNRSVAALDGLLL